MNLFGHFGEEKFYDKFTMLPLKMRTSVLEIWTSVLWYSSFINLSNTLQGLEFVVKFHKLEFYVAFFN